MKTHHAANRVSELTPDNQRYRECIYKHTTLALIEDAGDGDVTTKFFLEGNGNNRNKKAHALVISRASGILAGQTEVEYFLNKGPKRFRQGFSELKAHFFKKDGDKVKKGEILCSISGPVRDLFLVERTVLNVLGRMSGVATFAHSLGEKIRSARPSRSLAKPLMRPKGVSERRVSVILAPTRKTLWGLLDKRACALAGAGTHRLGLDNGILIKDNHLDMAGRDIEEVLTRIISSFLTGRKKNKNVHFIEIEVESPREAVRAARIFKTFKKRLVLPCFIMLDNMSAKKVRTAVRLLKSAGLRNAVGIEASGGITEQNLREYAKTDINIISMGALTQNCPSLNLSLEIEQ